MGQDRQIKHHDLQVLSVQEAKNLKLGQMGYEYFTQSNIATRTFTWENTNDTDGNGTGHESVMAIIQPLNNNTRVLIGGLVDHIDENDNSLTYINLVQGKFYYLMKSACVFAPISGGSTSVIVYRGDNSNMIER